MKIPDNFEAFQRLCAGGDILPSPGPLADLSAPPVPPPGLGFSGRLRWHVREYFRPKSADERLAILLARLRKL